MSAALEFLTAFNRKERYFVVKAALGGFSLSDDFRTKLSEKLGLNIPRDAFVAMDYHYTWLYAALFLASKGYRPSSMPPKEAYSNKGEIVKGNQEDIDLLVAFDEGDVTQVIVIEAKGVTGWTNHQLQSKANRLGEIFGGDGRSIGHVKPHFLLMSPRESQHINRDNWPAWLKSDEAWIELQIPPGLLRVSRSDDGGRASAVGDHWTVLREGRSTPLLE